MKKLLLPLSMILLFGCASKEAKEAVDYKKETPQITTTNPKQAPDMTSQLLANELGTDLVTEIKFAKGSSKLTPKARRQLNALWNKAKDKKDISKIQFITWSDKEYPTEKEDELGEEQVNLADDRTKTLENFFQDKYNKAEFSRVNMARRLSNLERFTASEKTEVKESLEVADIATTADKSGVTNASKSIVLIFYSE